MRVEFGELEVTPDFRTDCAAFIKATYVVDLATVSFAAEKAIKNWRSGKRISKSLPIEILLYHAATRQIKDALKTGIGSGKTRVAAVIIDEKKFEELKNKISFRSLKFKPEYDLSEVKKLYGITDAELEITGEEKLPLLVRERIALFSAMRE
jgi:KEOPS complex subunit Cgi121